MNNEVMEAAARLAALLEEQKRILERIEKLLEYKKARR